MKILVLGAGGMAGHIIALRLAELGHSIIGLARRKLDFCETIIADVHNIENLNILTGYDAIVNCVGSLNKAVDAEPSTGIWLNSCLPHLLAKLTKDTNTKIIHLSTDCVFSGYEGWYKEDSFRSADTLYGRSKALGELIDNKNLTFRMSIVGPDMNKNGIGLFNWFMKQNNTVSGYTDVIWSGVSTITLANAINSALGQNLTGLYHLVNNQTISKFELLKLFNTLRKEPIEIVPSNAAQENKSLVNTRSDFDFAVPSYAEMVQEIGEWMGRHNYE
jgi:dTDP-4-dehydrorhamnose reductase